MMTVERQRYWLLKEHPPELVERFLAGEHDCLPVSASEVRTFKCRSCGAMPYRKDGRLYVGCWGVCAQAVFGDVKDKHADRAARMKSAPPSRPQSSWDD